MSMAAPTRDGGEDWGLGAGDWGLGTGVFHSGVVRTSRSAVSGRPQGLHYFGVKNAVA